MKTPPKSPEESNHKTIETLALRIAKEAPSLADLFADQLESAARIVMGQRLVRDLDRHVNLAGIDYQEEKQIFLNQAGKTKSPHTKRAYVSALSRMEGFCERRWVLILNMKARDADDFAYALAAEGRAPSSVRRDIAAASSLFSFLERRYETIPNPLGGVICI